MGIVSILQSWDDSMRSYEVSQLIHAPKMLNRKVQILHPNFIAILSPYHFPYSNFLLNQKHALSHPSHTLNMIFAFYFLFLNSVFFAYSLPLPGNPQEVPFLCTHTALPAQIIKLYYNIYLLSICYGSSAW